MADHLQIQQDGAGPGGEGFVGRDAGNALVGLVNLNVPVNHNEAPLHYAVLAAVSEQEPEQTLIEEKNH